MAQRRKLVAGNWKMNGNLSTNAALLSQLVAVSPVSAEVAVCVPFPYLAQVQAALSSGAAGSQIALGAQDVSEYAVGAYTGEVSAQMLQDFGCRYVIVGHSERRALFAEDSDTVARKAKAVLAAGLIPIVCVGETLAEREAGQALDVIAAQLQPVASLLGDQLAQVVLAYEPVWAIGTGKTATPEQAQEVHAFIRAWLNKVQPAAASVVRVLYGGSVKANNAATLFAQPDIDGGLIGGAALVAEDFAAICAVA